MNFEDLFTPTFSSSTCLSPDGPAPVNNRRGSLSCAGAVNQEQGALLVTLVLADRLPSIFAPKSLLCLVSTRGFTLGLKKEGFSVWVS